MGDILSIIKPKDKVTIISLMLVLAALLATAIGVVTQATVDPHQHSYVYHIERGEDGLFDYVGVCSDENCENPRYVQNINSGVYETVITPASCSAEGEKEFSFTYGGKTYTLVEKIPVISHSYVGDINVGEGMTSVSADCTNEGCTAPEINVSLPTELQPTIEEATCSSPRYERYTFTHNGETVTVSSVTEVEIPHTLNGVPVTEFELSKGVYKYGTEGMVIISNANIFCGEQTIGCYICEKCKKTVDVLIGKPDHNYVYVESDTVFPDATKNGVAFVKCTNDECTDVVSVTLPKVVEGENAVVVEANHLEKYKKLAYSYVDEKYGFTVEFEIRVEWDEHSFVLLKDKTDIPSLTRAGRVYIGCEYEGCTLSKIHNIPKIVIGENAFVLSEASEDNPTIVEYTYYLENYGFTLTLEIEIGAKLQHNYKYSFERDGDGFVIKGRCDQPGCDEPDVIYKDLEISFADTSTCYKLGDKVWSCVYNGVTYTYTEPATEYPAHKLEYIASETVKPDFNNDGLAIIRCTNEGCTKEHRFTLPRVIVGTNALVTSTDPVSGVRVVRYIYDIPSYGIVIELNYDIPPHTHSYAYKLEPGSGPNIFDLVGSCTGHAWDCDTPTVREENVATSFKNTSTCIQIGESVWTHVKDGVSYEFRLPAFDFAKHVYTYSSDEIVNPTFIKEGSVRMFCITEGCGHVVDVALPKIVLGENSTSISYDEETKLHVVSYSVIVNGLLVELEIGGVEHVHNYVFELEPGIVSGYDLVGRCKGGEDCDVPVIREENVPTTFENTSSCTDLGHFVWTYVDGDNVYELRIPASELSDHSYTYTDAGIIAPTLDSNGQITIICANEKCSYSHKAELPKIVIDGNATTESFDEETGLRVLKYSVTVNGVLIEFNCSILDNHTHDLKYSLEPSMNFGKLDFIGRCTNELCDYENREVNVDAELVEDTTSCVAPGIKTWKYTRDGETYHCTVRFDVFFGHEYGYDPSASTTVKPTFDSTGSIVVYCNECDDYSVTVELPPVVINENATFVKETEYEVVYLYTHVTEDDFAISLIISFMK